MQQSKGKHQRNPEACLAWVFEGTQGQPVNCIVERLIWEYQAIVEEQKVEAKAKENVA